VCFLESDIPIESSTENEKSMSSGSSSSLLDLANSIKRTFGFAAIVCGRTMQGLEIALGGTGCDLKEGENEIGERDSSNVDVAIKFDLLFAEATAS
jgi:hypothetical protein